MQPPLMPGGLGGEAVVWLGVSEGGSGKEQNLAVRGLGQLSPFSPLQNGVVIGLMSKLCGENYKRDTYKVPTKS